MRSPCTYDEAISKLYNNHRQALRVWPYRSLHSLHDPRGGGGKHRVPLSGPSCRHVEGHSPRISKTRSERRPVSRRLGARSGSKKHQCFIPGRKIIPIWSDHTSSWGAPEPDGSGLVPDNLNGADSCLYLGFQKHGGSLDNRSPVSILIFIKAPSVRHRTLPHFTDKRRVPIL